MASRFSFVIDIEVERVQGKFATRDEMEEVIREALEGAQSDADLSGLGADGDSEYEITSWDVQDSVSVKGK